MKATELKRLHETTVPDSHYFSRETMRYFGDTMKNYRVTKILVTPYSVDCLPFPAYKLERRKPVRYALQAPCYFDLAGRILHGCTEHEAAI